MRTFTSIIAVLIFVLSLHSAFAERGGNRGSSKVFLGGARCAPQTSSRPNGLGVTKPPIKPVVDMNRFRSLESSNKSKHDSQPNRSRNDNKPSFGSRQDSGRSRVETNIPRVNSTRNDSSRTSNDNRPSYGSNSNSDSNRSSNDIKQSFGSRHDSTSNQSRVETNSPRFGSEQKRDNSPRVEFKRETPPIREDKSRFESTKRDYQSNQSRNDKPSFGSGHDYNRSRVENNQRFETKRDDRNRNENSRVIIRDNHDWNNKPTPRVIIRDDHDRNNRSNSYSYGRDYRRSYNRGYHHFSTSENIIALILLAAIISSNHNDYDSPVEIAKRNGTYFSSLTECTINFEGKYYNTYLNYFVRRPSVRPYWIPAETVCDGILVRLDYNEEECSYGSWDSYDPTIWNAYSFWDDDVMVRRTMASKYYLYRY